MRRSLRRRARPGFRLGRGAREDGAASPISARRGFVWSSINIWTNNLLSFVVITTLARLVGPREFGIVGLAGIFLAFGQVFIGETIGEALVQKAQLRPRHLDAAFWMMLGVGLVLSGLGIAVAPAIAAVFGQPALTLVLSILSLRLIFDSLLVVPQALLVRQLDFRSLAIRSLLANLAGGTIGIAIALAGGGVWALVAQQLVNALLTALVCFALAGWLPRPRLALAHGRDLLGYALPIALSRLCGFFGSNIDRALIGRTMSPMAVGYYNLAARIREMTHLSVTGVVSAVALPLFSRQQDATEQLWRSFHKAAGLTSVLAFPVFFGLAAVANEIVPVLFGAAWAPSAPVLQVMAVTGAVWSISTLHSSVIRALGRSAWWLRITAINVVLSTTFLLLLFPYGIVAMACASLITNLLTTPLHLRMLQRLLKFRLSEYLAVYAAPLLASALMLLAVAALRPQLAAVPPILALLAEVAAGAAVYGLAIALFARARAAEILRLGGVLQ
jgi:PST family polysaccharide transporter